MTIKEYGAINGFTTETYETLHKDAIKNPIELVINAMQQIK